MVSDPDDARVTALLAGLEAVERRLAVQARADPAAGLTDPEAETGERWEAGQVWSHMLEFVPYWLSEAERVAKTGSQAPVPIGRPRNDTGRLGGVERSRRTPPAQVMDGLSTELSRVRTFITDAIPQAGAVRARHPLAGDLDLVRIFEQFVLNHLEEHATQLEKLRATGA